MSTHVHTRQAIFFFCLGAVLTADAARGDLWVAGRDLALNEGPNGGAQEQTNPNQTVPQWSYGWRNAVSSTDFFVTPMMHSLDTTNQAFQGWTGVGAAAGTIVVNTSNASASYLANTLAVAPKEMALHPNNGATGGPVIVRFTVPATNTYDISAYWRDVDVNGGDGAKGWIVINGATIPYSQAFANGAAQVNSGVINLSLNTGDLVDFVLTNGGTDFNFDLTAFDATVSTSAVPEASAVVFVGLAACIAGGTLAWRRRVTAAA
jgi:hypothetical protein